jgi:hypothetical protein
MHGYAETEVFAPAVVKARASIASTGARRGFSRIHGSAFASALAIALNRLAIPACRGRSSGDTSHRIRAWYKNRQAGKQRGEKFHRSSVLRSCLDNSIIGQTTGGIKISNMFG